jgi:hypothetical protein
MNIKKSINILFIGATLLGMASIALAAQMVTLDVQLEVDNHIFTPTMTVAFGKMAVTHEVMADSSSYIIEVTPQRDIDQQIYLNCTLKKVTHGKIEVISHPKFITMDNQRVTSEEEDSATTNAKNVRIAITPHS